jgi:hypothetical protein
MMIRCFWMFQWVAVAGFICGNLDVLNASTITYSWSGSLRIYDSASPDPWGIGNDGAQFTMLTTVDMAAVDNNPVQTPFADFAALSSRLWVDGEEVAYVGSATIDFSDTADVADTIVMGGDFSKGGQTVSVFSLVGISPLAFSFGSPSETPPLFSSVLVTGLSEDLSRPYVASVPEGASVTVVPEPAMLGVAGASLFGLIAASRRSLNGIRIARS